jgi:hypothetical protein
MNRAGTVYFNAYRLSGPCGTLTAESGVLEATDGRSRRLPAPCAATRDDLRRRVDIQGRGGLGRARRCAQGRLRSRAPAAVSVS